MRLIDESDRRVIVLDPAPAGPAAARGGVARIGRPPGLSAWPWVRLRVHLADPWAIALLAAALSIGFFIWFEAHGLTLAFNDARIRELIARRVLDSRTPGLAQLGTTWLPLPSLLMLPLIWNDALFRSGLAGSLLGMNS